MDEQRQLLFVNQFLPSNEQKLIDRLRESATRRATRPPEVTAVLRDFPLDAIDDIVVGPSYVGVLFTDGQIGRFPYVATSRALQPSSSPATSTAASSTAPAASDASGGRGARQPPGIDPVTGAPVPGVPSGLISRSAKFRRYESILSGASGRVMLAASGRRGHGGSVIIDRSRPMVPAASVPEDLIAQAQVVLQGKTREVIIRELQRTNLNVNEAVNNLLSRDDDDDEGSEGADMLIPEELLSMLDSHPGGADYEQDQFEYLLSGREKARDKSAKEKEKQKSSKPVIESNSDTEALRRYEIPSGSISEPWEGIDNKETAVGGPRRFTHMACTQSELLAISTDNKLYGWKWTEAVGDDAPHVMYEKLKLAEGEVLTHISACSLRVAVMTSAGRLASWLDSVACGERLTEALFVPPQKLGGAAEGTVEQVVVSNHLAVARFPNNVFYWCGLYPVNDRRRIFEKARSRQRKHVTFDTTQIVEGSEVRTKSGPIYSIGCIAANLAAPTPMIGILMENAWSLSEVCRFRLLDPAAYDADRFDPAAAAAAASEADSREAVVAQQALSSGNRKRPATEELFSAETKQREEPWPISDVIFIHEEVQNDTAIVKIVDGGYCALEYQQAAASPTDSFATTASKQLASKGDKEKPQQKFRLIRKDELTVVSHKMRYARSPNSMRIEPYRFVLSGSSATKRVISAVADSLGIRALVERRGAASIVRISVCGKTLTSHSLPIHAPSLHSMDGEKKPTLINYGDDAILLLHDAHGGIIPLVRDAAAGFKEPTYLQLAASPITALTVKSIKEKDRPSWAPKANREAVIVSLQGTNARTIERRLPSLLYAVMACDQEAVQDLLDFLQKEEDLSLSQREIVEARADGGRNVLHAAVMNAFATKNSLEADVANPLSVLTTSESRSSAEQVRAALDKKWNEMLKTRSSNRSSGSGSSGGASSSAAAAAANLDAISEKAIAVVSSESVVLLTNEEVLTIQDEVKKEIEEKYGALLLVKPSPVENAKERQENAIAIVKMLVTHPICMPFLADLLSCRDIHGQTPFMAAVNHRAYSAADDIFKAVKSLFIEGDNGKLNSSMAEQLLPFIFPAGCRPDDSPLFILCYNDTCSFTWTGDEHINQDIFECRTCGLTGSLCCCTECALTCHRNHDCKLKRTSPTAYCDCWEKACCKALVNGNQHARESLLIGLIGKSNLYTMLNGRGEHILLYLARKLARQSSEQWNYTRRARRIQAPGGSKDSQIPEHDLDPPKFARTALLYCLRNWTVIKSLAMIGVRQMDQSVPMAEEMFHLNAQHGSSHLDKFMLILLTKCSDETNIALESLLRILTETHNRARQFGEPGELEEVNFVISRFVRSVARLFILAVVISSVAASTAVSGLAPSRDSSISPSSLLDRHPPFRGISFSGIFGHLRKDTTKDSKLKNMGMFVVRCKIFFEHFAVFTLHEMAQLADASLAPVRTGIIRPCVSLSALFGSTADSIENLEKYINSEPDVTQSMGGRRDEGEERGGGEQREEKRRKRRGDMSSARYGRWFGSEAPSSSRRDTDRDEPPSESQGGEGGAGGGTGTGERSDREKYRVVVGETSEDDSDGSDSDGDAPSSRRITSQSDAIAANAEAAANEEAARNSRDDEELSSSDDDEDMESDSEGDLREEDEDEEEDEDMQEERVDGGEEEDTEMEYVTSEATSAREEEQSRVAGDEGEEEEEANDGGPIRRRLPQRSAGSRGDRTAGGTRRMLPNGSWVPIEEGRAENEGGQQQQQSTRSTGSRTPRRGRWVDDAWVPAEEASEERSASNSGQQERVDAYDFLIDGSSEGEEPSSPEYSSLSEGDEQQRGGRRGGRRRRREAAAAAAAEEAADAAEDDALEAQVRADLAAAGRAPPVGALGVSADRVIGLRIEPSSAEREEMEREERERDSDEDVMERVERVAVSDALDALEESERGGGGEEREGEGSTAARTRPAEGSRDAAAAAAEEREPIASTGRRANTRQVARRGGLAMRVGSRREASSVGGGEGDGGGSEEGADRLTSRRNATADGRRPRITAPTIRAGHSSGGWAPNRPPLPPWVTRRATGDSIEGSRLAIRATGGRRLLAPTSEAHGGGSSSSSDEKKTETQELKEDETPTAGKAAIQLAAAFSFAVRTISELLPVVAAGGSNSGAYARASCSPSRLSTYRDMEQLNELEEAVRRRAIDHVGTRLEDSWRWLAVVLDHAEAQIKYINAVASTEETRKKESKESKKKGSQRKKSPHASPTAPAEVPSSSSRTAPLSPVHSKARRETMACLLGLLRAHSGEAGDDTPLVDLDTLRAPALVVDAYLGFVESKADAEKMFEQSKKKKEASSVARSSRSSGSASPDKKSGEEEIVGVRRFYQRSNSVSFPGASFTDAHDTLQLSCLQSLPIVERPQLLTSTVEKEVIFGPPPSTQERTKEEHDKVIRSHGVSHPHNQSLTAAPVSSHRLFVEGEEGEKKEEEEEDVLMVAAPARSVEEVGGKEEVKKKPAAKGRGRGRKRARTGEVKPDDSDVIVIDDDEPEAAASPPAQQLQQQPPVGFEKVTYEEILETFKIFREHPLRKLMGRWRFALQLIAKELHGDLTEALGGDLSGSRLLRELAGFGMKQHELRARMEKYRSTATKDVSIEVHRDPAALIRETCYQLNRTFTRRMAMKGTEKMSGSGVLRGGEKKDESLPVLASHKVKVKFTDEPGEGTGVARSYYTALAEALASLRQLPFTDYGYTPDNDEYLYGGSAPTGGPGPSPSSSSGRRIQLIRGRDTFYATVTSSASGAASRSRRIPLNYLHPPYTPADMAAAEALNVSPDFLADLREETYTRREGAEKLPTELVDRLFILIRAIYPAAAARLTGMFMDLPLSHIILVLGDPAALKSYLGDAIDQMMTTAAPTDIALLRGEDEKKDLAPITSTEADDAPLFFRPSKKAHYSPVPGRLSPARMNAFRNVGRVIGLCLMQCEMFPLRLSRHVLKYILGRPLNWHDFAFYDPQMFESLRKLIVDGCSTPDHRQFFDDLQMTFSIDMPPEATGMPSSTLDLIPGGSDVLVTKDNIIEYVYRFVEARLLGSTNGRCLAAIRQGVQDVIPQAMLDNLTAEDLRLVLCGTETVSLSLMQSYTAWTDESHAEPEAIEKFKQWFWQVADRLSAQEKQDLIFFWTGAPSLPSTEEGFQPLPTIVIRPTDDGFLPTANTCISRLYLPLYNSKKTLTAKLQLAIKAKNFGFV